MMKREKFLEDAKADPARFYRMPNDVLRDRRLADDDRRAILAAWQKAADEGDGQPELAALIQRATQELSEDGESAERRTSGA